MKDIAYRQVSPDTFQELQASIATALHPAALAFEQAMVQVADLPFYEGFKLYAVTDLRLPTGNVYELLCGPGGAFLLDGSNEPIYEVNKLAPIKLDSATLAPYIRFFLQYTCSSMGQFIIAETMEGIPWLPEASEEEMAEAAAKLEPITYKGTDEDGFFTLSGTIVLHDCLYRTDILVAAREREMKDPDPEEIEQLMPGEIRLVNEEVLLENLKVHSEDLPEDDGQEDTEEDDQEIGLHAATAFQLYEAFPQTDGINFQEQTTEIAAEVVASFPPEIQPTATPEDGFLLQTAELPFYPNFSLCALTDQAASSPNVRFFLLKQGPTGMIVPMNKTNEPVYAINEDAPITLTAETLPPYAKFFFFLVQGQLGRFIIADKPEGLVWLPKATAKEKADVAAHLMPVTYNGIDTDGLHSLKATVIFHDALFRTDIKIAPREMDVFDPELNAPEHFTIGQIKLANEELLLEGLNVPIALTSGE